MNIPSNSALAHLLVAALFVIMPLQQARSAPGTLPAAPLFLSTIIEPNIFFSLDDSGSMAWTPMISASVGGLTIDASRGIPIFNGSLRKYYNLDMVAAST